MVASPRPTDYPAILTTTTSGAVDGILNGLARPESNVPPVASVTNANCAAPATCLGGVCTMPAVKDFIDWLDASSDFLSCTGSGSYENTWPPARVIPLDTGPCDPIAEYHRIYGYRVSNSTGSDSARWWTINPGEEIRFNVFGGALLFATTAEVYTVCSPGFMRKTVSSLTLTRLTAGRTDLASISIPQSSPVELVRYTVDGGGGSLVITRERELTIDLHLYVYPNYFGVGTPPFPQYNPSDLEQLIIKLARNVNGFSPLDEGGERVISPERYPVLACHS